jgi:hypothetical protein
MGINLHNYEIIWLPILRRYIQWTIETPIDKQTNVNAIPTEIAMILVLTILIPFNIVRKT